MKKFLLGVFVGGLYVMFFAQKTGKELMKEVQKSPTPVKTFFKEGAKVDFAFIKFISEKITKYCDKK